MSDNVSGGASAFGAGSEQAGGSDFLASLPEDLRSNEVFKGFKGVGDLAKDYLGVKGAADKKFSELSPEDQDKYFAGRGRPADPNGYEIKGEGVNEKLVGFFKEQAFKLGLSKKGAEEFAGNFLGLARQAAEEETAASVQAASKQSEAQLAAIKAKYGDKFDTSMSKATNAVRQLGGAGLLEVIKSSGLGINEAFVAMMVKVGDMVKEGSLPDAGGQGGSAQSVREEINKLYSDAAFMKAYNTPGMANHRANQDRMVQLQQQLASFKQ